MRTIQVPHKFKPRKYQLNLIKAMEAGAKRAVIIWHRRSGKEKTCLNIMVTKMLERVGTYYYFFPEFSQGRKIIWDGIDKDGFRFIDHIPKELIVSKNDHEMKIKLSNGSMFQIIGTDNIDSIVGSNPIGCVFSEYAIQRPKAWEFIRPILAENGGWAIFDYTPRGMNHGWKLYQQAKTSDWFNEVLTVDQTNAISPEALREEYTQMPEDLFEQEYYCKFVEGAGQFFRRIDENIWDGVLLPNSNRYYQIGVDLAKMQDFTVLTPFDLTTFRVGKPERFNQIDYNLQKAKIEAMYLRYFKAKIWIDSTGVGEPIYDDLSQSRVSNIYPYHFTESTRHALLNNLRILIEQDKIKIPEDEIMLSELKSMQYELSDRGTVRIRVPEGIHDDCIMSLALATWDIPARQIPVKVDENKKLLKEFDFYKQGREGLTGSRYLRHGR